MFIFFFEFRIGMKPRGYYCMGRKEIGFFIYAWRKFFQFMKPCVSVFLFILSVLCLQPRKIHARCISFGIFAYLAVPAPVMPGNAD